MRARRGHLLGWAAVGAYTVLLGVTAWVAVGEDDADRGPTVTDTGGEAAAQAFIEAWERSRTATFVTTGTYERHSDVTGATISSEDVVAQRPPRRIHRQLGGVDGRNDDRVVVCPAPPPGEDAQPCRLGEPGGRTYDESVAVEVDGLRSILLGRSPLYSVVAAADGCFELDQLRIDPRAPFGIDASFCFDAETGAPTRRRIRHEGGVEERLVVTRIRATVSDADLEP